MTMKTLLLCLAAACGLFACAPSSPEPSPDPTVTYPTAATAIEYEEVSSPPIIIDRKPSPEMLRAALANDPKAMTEAAVALGGCQASSTCPASYGSCGTWSDTFVCDQTCDNVPCLCKPWMEPCEGELRMRDHKNAYQVCFNAQGASCTNWKLTSSTYCGC